MRAVQFIYCARRLKVVLIDDTDKMHVPLTVAAGEVDVYCIDDSRDTTDLP